VDTDYFFVNLAIDPWWLGLWTQNITGQELWHYQFLREIPVSSDTVPTEKDFIYWSNDEDGISEQVALNYSATQIPGRAESYQTYMGAENRQIGLNLWFYALEDYGTWGRPLTEGTETTNPNLFPWQGNDASPSSVVFWARWLDQLKQPLLDPTTKLSHAPPPCILRIGKLLVARVILADMNLTWHGPFVPGDMLPHSAECACTFTVVRREAGVVGNETGYDRVPGVPWWNDHRDFVGA
jgi:hypothetical protein